MTWQPHPWLTGVYTGMNVQHHPSSGHPSAHGAAVVDPFKTQGDCSFCLSSVQKEGDVPVAAATTLTGPKAGSWYSTWPLSPYVHRLPIYKASNAMPDLGHPHPSLLQDIPGGSQPCCFLFWPTARAASVCGTARHDLRTTNKPGSSRLLLTAITCAHHHALTPF